MNDQRPPPQPPEETPALAEPVPCPVWGERLRRDPLWHSPHWLWPWGHSYSNTEALLAEMRARGWSA